MDRDTFDSNIYENTTFMTESRTNAPETNEVDTNYEPLRMENGKLSQVEAVTTRQGKCAKRRWWLAGAVVTILLCIGCTVFTGLEAGTSLFRNKSDGIKDKASDNHETTQLPDTLQEQVNILQLKFEEIQREMEEEKAKFKIEKTRLQSIQSATEAKFININEAKVNTENRLTEVEKNTAENHQEITQVTNTLQEQVNNVQSRLEVRQRSIDEKITKLNIKTIKLEGNQNTTDDKIENSLQKNIADHQEITQVTNTLQEQVNNVQSRLEVRQRSIDEKITKLNIKTTKLEGNQNTTEDKIENSLQTRLTEVEKKMTVIQTEQSRAETSIENYIDEVENRLAELESTQNKKTTAFSVYPSAGALNLDQDGVVPFNTIIIDSMGGFVNDKHQYICPTTGTYFFSLCLNFGPLGGAYKENSEVILEVGGNKIMDVYSSINGDGKHSYDQGCDAIIYKCSAGSSVLVKCNLSTGCRMVGKSGRPQSILSAFLIYPE